MAKLEFATAASAVAAASTLNVMGSRQEFVAPYPRTIQALSVAITDNTPALGDISWELFAGQQKLATGRGILARTAGAEFTYPDDYATVGMRIPPNVPLVLNVTTLDGAAHGCIVSMLLDVL